MRIIFGRKDEYGALKTKSPSALEYGLRLNIGLRRLAYIHAIMRRLARLLQVSVPESLAFDQEKSAGREQQQAAGAGECERPTEIVVVPVGHPVAAVAVAAENQAPYQAAHACQDQVAADAQQKEQVFVVVPAAEAIQPSEEHCDQQQRHV